MVLTDCVLLRLAESVFDTDDVAERDLVEVTDVDCEAEGDDVLLADEVWVVDGVLEVESDEVVVMDVEDDCVTD